MLCDRCLNHCDKCGAPLQGQFPSLPFDPGTSFPGHYPTSPFNTCSDEQRINGLTDFTVAEGCLTTLRHATN